VIRALGGGSLGNGAADASAGTLNNMFDFDQPNAQRSFLDPSAGEPRHAG
jgi:hypothetical protein